MRVVQLDFADPAFPARLVERPDPGLPAADWARIAVSGGGICGSDLHIFSSTVGPPTALYSYGTLPMELGHEIAGTVVEAGPECALGEGTRVAVNPILGCAARGVDPPCDRCADGAASTCRNLGSRRVTDGMGLGFTHGLGGGWGDLVVAHESQLHELPHTVGPDAETLPEPLSIVIHGLLRVPPRDGPVLVIGAGVIGLLAVSALRNLYPDVEVVVLAKHPHQIDAARTCGAHTVVVLSDDVYGALAEASATDVRGAGADAMLAAGFPYVVEAVGTETALGQAFRCVDSRGTVLLLGASGVSSVDMSPVWFKEFTVTGSFCHAHDPRPTDNRAVHSFDQAIELLAAGLVPALALVTHEFALHDWRQAVDTALARERGAIKVVLRPDPPS